MASVFVLAPDRLNRRYLTFINKKFDTRQVKDNLALERALRKQEVPRCVVAPYYPELGINEQFFQKHGLISRAVFIGSHQTNRDKVIAAGGKWLDLESAPLLVMCKRT
jgi:hypothetical protein